MTSAGPRFSERITSTACTPALPVPQPLCVCVRMLTHSKEILTHSKEILTHSKEILTHSKQILTRSKQILTYSTRTRVCLYDTQQLCCFANSPP